MFRCFSRSGRRHLVGGYGAERSLEMLNFFHSSLIKAPFTLPLDQRARPEDIHVSGTIMLQNLHDGTSLLVSHRHRFDQFADQIGNYHHGSISSVLQLLKDSMEV